MNPYKTFSHCTNCYKKYHHQVMIQTDKGINHYCLKCFNLKENENEKRKKQTHYNQMITVKTRKLLEKLCRKSKLSKPMQLERLLEEATVFFKVDQ